MKLITFIFVALFPVVAHGSWLAEASLGANATTGLFSSEDVVGGTEPGYVFFSAFASGGYRLTLPTSAWSFEASLAARETTRARNEADEGFFASDLQLGTEWRDFVIPVVGTIPTVRATLDLPTSERSRDATQLLKFASEFALDQPLFDDILRIGLEISYSQRLHKTKGPTITPSDLTGETVFVSGGYEQRALSFGGRVEFWLTDYLTGRVQIARSTHWGYPPDAVDEFFPSSTEGTRAVAKLIHSSVSIAYVLPVNDLLTLDVALYTSTSQPTMTPDNRSASFPLWSRASSDQTTVGLAVTGYFNGRDRYR